MIKKIILNCSKIKVITFIRVNPYFTNYTLSGYELDLKLKFSDYYFIYNRWSKEFSDPYVTKTLFISLVRPILEYCTPVWSPNTGYI